VLVTRSCISPGRCPPYSASICPPHTTPSQHADCLMSAFRSTCLLFFVSMSTYTLNVLCQYFDPHADCLMSAFRSSFYGGPSAPHTPRPSTHPIQPFDNTTTVLCQHFRGFRAWANTSTLSPFGPEKIGCGLDSKSGWWLERLWRRVLQG